VESILIFLREGRSSKNAISIDVAATVQTVCDEFADAGHDVRLEASEHAAIQARPDELRRALANVVDNAVRYAGSATVNLARRPEGIVIAVEDEGPGIPEDQIGLVTRPFYRVDSARSQANGTGLGMAIVQRLVSRHRGTLKLRNRAPGPGLEVTIEFPLTKSA